MAAKNLVPKSPDTQSKDATPTATPFISMTNRQFGQVLGVGAGVGILTWLLGVVFINRLLATMLCRENVEASLCVNTENYAWYAAMVVGGLVGLFILAKLMVFRPLLVVLAALVALWGVWLLIGVLPWYGALLALAALFTLAYGLFTWLARLRSFVLALLLIAALVVIVRLILPS